MGRSVPLTCQRARPPLRLAKTLRIPTAPPAKNAKQFEAKTYVSILDKLSRSRLDLFFNAYHRIPDVRSRVEDPAEEGSPADCLLHGGHLHRRFQLSYRLCSMAPLFCPGVCTIAPVSTEDLGVRNRALVP